VQVAGTLLTVTADANGDFVIGNVPAGTHTCARERAVTCRSRAG
jgi:hypothetical protein